MQLTDFTPKKLKIEFDVEVKESIMPRMYEEVELKALLEEE